MRKVTFKQELVDNNIELSVRHLRQYFKFGHGASSLTTKAVNNISFDIKKGECFGLVGESGCGKTTTGRSLIRLYHITSGSIYFEGQRISAGKRWNEKEIKWSRIKGLKQIKALKKERDDELFFSLISYEDADEILALRKKEDALREQIVSIKEKYLEDKENLKNIDDYAEYKKQSTELNKKYRADVKENRSELIKTKDTLRSKRRELIGSRNISRRSEYEHIRKENENKNPTGAYSRFAAVTSDGKVVGVFNDGKDTSNNKYRNGSFAGRVGTSETELDHYQDIINASKGGNEVVKNYTEVLDEDEAAVLGLDKFDAINKKYELKIKRIKKSIKETRKVQKEEIKQINFDNRHVDKKLMSKMQMIFQDPVDSLDPRMTVEDIIQEGLHIQGQHNKFANSKKVADVLEKVGLIPEYASRYPHEFSGGQRQRIGIARALVMNPRFLICDEPISALDVSIRAQIINLLNELKEEMGLTIMFIAHDLSVVKYFCDRIAVMYFGQMVELASSDELFKHPLHPYAKALLSAIPKPDPLTEKTRKRIVYNPKTAHDYSKEKPTLQEILPGHWILANSEEMEKYRKEIAELDKKSK